MSAELIVSYDGTSNDEDALALGGLLGASGARVALAYVRHAHDWNAARERIAQHDAERLLEQGALGLTDPDAVDRHVVVHASTPAGLEQLAMAEGARVIVFGSEYRTAAGHVAPQKSTQALLEGSPAAIAIAPASYRSEDATTFGRVGLLAAPGDDAALDSARELAESLGARLTRDEPHVDLLVIGSRPEAPEGRIVISSQAWHVLENATAPVLVVPRGVNVSFLSAIAA